MLLEDVKQTIKTELAALRMLVVGNPLNQNACIAQLDALAVIVGNLNDDAPVTDATDDPTLPGLDAPTEAKIPPPFVDDTPVASPPPVVDDTPVAGQPNA